MNVVYYVKSMKKKQTLVNILKKIDQRLNLELKENILGYCKLCKKREVTDKNPKITICDVCRLEIELSFTYHINGKEVTREEYDKQIKEAFKNE